MKKYILILLLLFVVACSSDNTSGEVEADDQSQSEEVETGEEANDTGNEEEDENKETENARTQEDIEQEGRLTEVGDISEDQHGKVELLKIANINETIEHGPLEINFVNAKILKWSDIPSNIVNQASRFGDVTDDEFDFLQIRMIVENTSDKDIIFYGIDSIVTDNKQQIEAASEEFLGNFVDGEYLGNVKKEYVQGYILKDSDIKNLRVVFSYVEEMDTYETIAEKLDYDINFE
ncbi:hypothetical protein [Gracilibacillus salinarum]|uniref:DUF4352 domain-containing protein n=1 Tax=Gracilibacillus salinarum TaxID=2932255 RepID=A0ABY4GMV4_9BACI|nr:hypothetical protein [Gracilibacillus salinarum]UOQ85708.1 hypothetical protein MUN87_02030 [Gracilibacillus salinarum]